MGCFNTVLSCSSTSGCGVKLSTSQSPSCKKYLTCYDKALGTTSLDSTYGSTGTCWASTQAVADSCTAACTAALPSMKTSFPSVTECQ